MGGKGGGEGAHRRKAQRGKVLVKEHGQGAAAQPHDQRSRGRRGPFAARAWRHQPVGQQAERADDGVVMLVREVGLIHRRLRGGRGRACGRRQQPRFRLDEVAVAGKDQAAQRATLVIGALDVLDEQLARQRGCAPEDHGDGADVVPEREEGDRARRRLVRHELRHQRREFGLHLLQRLVTLAALHRDDGQAREPRIGGQLVLTLLGREHPLVLAALRDDERRQRLLPHLDATVDHHQPVARHRRAVGAGPARVLQRQVHAGQRRQGLEGGLGLNPRRILAAAALARGRAEPEPPVVLGRHALPPAQRATPPSGPARLRE